jgi:predicted nucleic-acid-binding protein
MIGLDTNILVRYITQDDPIQSAKAAEIFERQLTEENPGFVSIVAMVETAWVLERAYGLATRDVVRAIERVLQTNVLVVENEQEVFTAMIALKENRGSFADAVIAALGARMGCSFTVTFDKKALRIPGFQLPN